MLNVHSKFISHAPFQQILEPQKVQKTKER